MTSSSLTVWPRGVRSALRNQHRDIFTWQDLLEISNRYIICLRERAVVFLFNSIVFIEDGQRRLLCLFIITPSLVYMYVLCPAGLFAEDTVEEASQTSWVVPSEPQQNPGACSQLVCIALCGQFQQLHVDALSRRSVSSEISLMVSVVDRLRIFSASNTCHLFHSGLTRNQGIIMHPPLGEVRALLPLLRPLMALMSSCTVMHEDVWVTSDPELPLTITQELLPQQQLIVQQATYNPEGGEYLFELTPKFRDGEWKYDTYTMLMTEKAPIIKYMQERQSMGSVITGGGATKCSAIGANDACYAFIKAEVNTVFENGLAQCSVIYINSSSKRNMYSSMGENSCLCFALEGVSRRPPPEAPPFILFQPLNAPTLEP
eukprot:Em0016g568a